VDVKKTPPSSEQVAAWWAAVGPRLVNRQGTTWRQLSAAEQALTGDELIDLIARHPALIKRPLLIDGDVITVGLDSPLLPAPI